LAVIYYSVFVFEKELKLPLFIQVCLYHAYSWGGRATSGMGEVGSMMF
jgi:hypothetical protein